MVRTGMLTRERRGREIHFSLTRAGIELLDEAADRVRGPHPFDLHGAGWTLVTFSISEEQRALRHRLRSTLTWEGFAPIRDGLWLAPGEIDLATPLSHLSETLPDGSIVAFHAREVEAFPIAASVRQAWDIDYIRSVHAAFIETWSDPSTVTEPVSALAARTMLVADWLALLRADPGLPPVYMDDEWPSSTSVAVYRRLREGLAEEAHAEFAAINAGKAVAVPS